MWVKNSRSNNRFIGVLILLLAGSYILLELTHLETMATIAGCYAVLFILFSIFVLKGKAAKITYGLLVMTIALLFLVENPLPIILEGALINLPIVCILVVTPLFGISVRAGNYVESLKCLLKEKNSNVSFLYVIFLLLTHLFSVLLNIGSIMINFHLINSSNVKSKRLIANVLNRGYTTTANWSPYLGVMALVLSHLHIGWSSLAVYTIGFTLISIVVAILIDAKSIHKEKKNLHAANFLMEEEPKFESKIKMSKGIAELTILLALSMGLVLMIDMYTEINIVLAISLVSLAFPLFWCILKKQINFYKDEISNHAKKTLPNLQTEFSMFLVAGIFGNVFVNTPVSHKFIELLTSFFGNSAFILTIVLSFLIIISGVLGLHPGVMLTILVTSIEPAVLGFSPLYFAALLLGSTGIANTISPATAVNNLISNTLRVDLFTVSVKWNWSYALILFLLLPIYLNFVGI